MMNYNVKIIKDIFIQNFNKHLVRFKVKGIEDVRVIITLSKMDITIYHDITFIDYDNDNIILDEFIKISSYNVHELRKVADMISFLQSRN